MGFSGIFLMVKVGWIFLRLPAIAFVLQEFKAVLQALRFVKMPLKVDGRTSPVLDATPLKAVQDE